MPLCNGIAYIHIDCECATFAVVFIINLLVETWTNRVIDSSYECLTHSFNVSVCVCLAQPVVFHPICSRALINQADVRLNVCVCKSTRANKKVSKNEVGLINIHNRGENKIIKWRLFVGSSCGVVGWYKFKFVFFFLSLSLSFLTHSVCLCVSQHEIMYRRWQMSLF